MTTPSEQEAQWLKLGHEDEILAAFTAYDRLVRWEEHNSRLDATEPIVERAYARGKIIAMVANFAAEALGVTSGEDATTPNGDAILASREVEADARLAELEGYVTELISASIDLRAGSNGGQWTQEGGDERFVKTAAWRRWNERVSAVVGSMQSAPIAAPAEEGGRA